jgi:hypothetical protein
MRENRPYAIRALACAGLVTAAFTGLEVGIRMAAEAAGMWGIVAASTLFPLTIAGAPLLALLWGQWIPALVVYGGGLASAVLYARHETGTPARDYPATS